MNLPNAWNINDISDVLNVDSDGLILECTGESGPTTIRMNYPIYPKCGIFYFEIRINKGTNGLIGIGFCTKTVDTNIYLDGTMNPGVIIMMEISIMIQEKAIRMDRHLLKMILSGAV